jgi:hopanoid biosynthesis associated protein HpnK
MRARLIVNADDLGLHPGINAGILEAHRNGIVTSASICANGAAFEDAVRLLRETPALGVGVHLTLVGEKPLSDPLSLPRLAPEGRLPGYFTGLFARLFVGAIPEPEIERELTAQVAHVHDSGIRVSHLDSHQHVHLHPKLLPVVVRVARRFGVAAVRAARSVSPFSGIRPALLSLFSGRAARALQAAGLRTPDASLGLADSGRLDERRLRALLHAVPDGVSELVCHPGVDGDSIARAYPWGFRWDAETRALTAVGLREELVSRGVRLVSYRDL